MKEFKGTPGPWVVDVDGVDARWNIDSLDRVSVAVTNQVANDKNWLVLDANTNLIAAAPDLLEALKDMLSGWKYIREHHGDLYGVGWDRAQDKAQAAISKALGEE